MIDKHEQSEQKLEKQTLPELFKWNFDISVAEDKDIKDVIEDQDSKLFRIRIKVQPDEHWVRPGDYIESIDNEYLENFKTERIKKKTWWKRISESKRKELEEEWEEWHIENIGRKEDWEAEMNDKYKKLWEQKKELEKKRMKSIRYRDIEKYKGYPTVYNKLLRIMDHSENIENIDLVVMINSERYKMEKFKKNVNDCLSEILSKESNIEEIRQDRNKTMEATKANVLYILSQIQEKWNTLINEIWENKYSVEEIVQVAQLFEKMINSIPQNISINMKKKADRIKFIYRREWASWYKYNDTIDFLKREWKQIIDC